MVVSTKPPEVRLVAGDLRTAQSACVFWFHVKLHERSCLGVKGIPPFLGWSSEDAFSYTSRCGSLPSRGVFKYCLFVPQQVKAMGSLPRWALGWFGAAFTSPACNSTQVWGGGGGRVISKCRAVRKLCLKAAQLNPGSKSPSLGTTISSPKSTEAVIHKSATPQIYFQCRSVIVFSNGACMAGLSKLACLHNCILANLYCRLAHLHTYKRTYLHTYRLAHLHTCILTCKYTCIHAYISILMHICISCNRAAA